MCSNWTLLDGSVVSAECWCCSGVEVEGLIARGSGIGLTCGGRAVNSGGRAVTSWGRASTRKRRQMRARMKRLEGVFMV